MYVNPKTLKAVANFCKRCVADRYNAGTSAEQITACDFEGCDKFDLRPILPYLIKGGVPDKKGIERLRIRLSRHDRKR